MEDNKVIKFLQAVLENMPASWLNLTTHRLDIYEEKLAKTQFLNQLESLLKTNNSSSEDLKALPTAYDYIRLGHPLSSILEWTIANLNGLPAENIISFSSSTIPILAILRKNLLENKKTKIYYTDALPSSFDTEILKGVYAYKFEVEKVENIDAISSFNGSSIFLSTHDNVSLENAIISAETKIDFFVNILPSFGSILIVNGAENEIIFQKSSMFEEEKLLL